MIGNILIFSLVGIPFADQNTAMHAVEILGWICQNCPIGFVEIINGGIRTDISRIFQDRGQLGIIEIHAAGGNGIAGKKRQKPLPLSVVFYCIGTVFVI